MQLSALLLALPFLAAQTALGAPTGTEAKRSTVSAGTTCYYNCPMQYELTDGSRCSVNNMAVATTGSCSYNCYDAMFGMTLISTQTCNYDTSTGAPIAVGSTTTSCPTTVSQTCGGSQSFTQFKRSVAKRELSPAEKVIAARQYKYTPEPELNA